MDIVERARLMQQAVDELGAGPAASLVALRARAEVSMTCPGCGKTGSLRRIGGGSGASRFICEGYRYDPNSGNECRFRFLVDDRFLRRFK